MTIPRVSAEQIERSRRSPADEVLKEVGAVKHHLTPPIGRVIANPKEEADELLKSLSTGLD